MKLGRYSDQPSLQFSSGFLQTSHKLARSIHNSLPKNPELFHDSPKLPSLTGMRKSASSFTMQRNTRNQLSLISQKVEQIQDEVHNARMDANQTLNHLRFLKQELLDNKLTKDSQDIKSQISGLKKLVQITKATHESRSHDLRQDYIRLWNQTEQLRQLIFDVRIRIDKIEETMGNKR